MVSVLYEIPTLKHAAPSTVEEVVYLLEKYGERAKLIAGGTDLLGLLKDSVTGPKMPMPEVLISVKNVASMRAIGHSEAGGLSIGAAVTLTELAESMDVRMSFPVVSQAALSVATPQIRNAGTVGGNLCQRPWCWYFRSPMFPCFKKGGKQCYAIPGEHRYYFSVMGLGTCVMGHPSDLAAAFMSTGGSIRVAGPSGSRWVPVEEFFNGPKEVFDNILKPNELVVEVRLANDLRGPNSSFVKYRIRETWDLSLASAAVALKLSNGRCMDARVAFGGLAPYPYRAIEVEHVLKGSELNGATSDRAAGVIERSAKVLPMTKYKVHLAKAVLRRAIVAASGR